MSRFFFLILAMFTVGSSSFMIAGLLPKIGETLGQPVSITSQGITAFSLTYLFSAPLFSMVFAVKSAKRTLQLALVIFLLGALVTLTSESLVQFILGRILTGLGAGIFNPLCVSIAMQMANQKTKGKILSLVWGANSAGVVFGVPFAIFLSNWLSWQFSIGYVFALGLIALLGFSLQNIHFDRPHASSLQDRLRLLTDKNVLSVTGITCLTAMASLGLYSYIASIQTGAPSSLTVALFAWGLGGFVGSSFVGYFVDRTREPRMVTAFILLGLLLTFVAIPFAKNIPVLGLLLFFAWGAFGWATPTPQQHILFELYESHRAILSALNSSAIGLGSSIGTVIGGVLISSGVKEINLPYLSAVLVIATIIAQLTLIRKFRLRSA